MKIITTELFASKNNPIYERNFDEGDTLLEAERNNPPCIYFLSALSENNPAGGKPDLNDWEGWLDQLIEASEELDQLIEASGEWKAAT